MMLNPNRNVLLVEIITIEYHGVLKLYRNHVIRNVYIQIY